MKKQKYELIEKKNAENNTNDSESISRKLDICPYCGGQMELRFKTDEDYPKRYGYRNYSRGKFGVEAYMYCDWCTARSPEFVVKPRMIDMNIAMEYLNVLIDDTIADRLADEEEESDDE